MTGSSFSAVTLLAKSGLTFISKKSLQLPKTKIKIGRMIKFIFFILTCSYKVILRLKLKLRVFGTEKLSIPAAPEPPADVLILI